MQETVLNFSGYTTVEQLNKLRDSLMQQIDEEIQRRKEEIQKDLQQQISEAAEAIGEKPEFFLPETPKRAKKTARKSTKQVTYQNPNDPSETFSPGRGRQRPEWLLEYQRSGRPLEEIEVHKESPESVDTTT